MSQKPGSGTSRRPAADTEEKRKEAANTVHQESPRARGESGSDQNGVTGASEEIRRLVAALRFDLYVKDVRIRGLQTYLAAHEANQASVAWQLILRFRDWKERILPAGSRWRKAYEVILAWVGRRLTRAEVHPLPRPPTPVPTAGELEDHRRHAPVLEPTLPTALHPSPKRLRILTYRWHCGHQYELYKLSFDFALVRGLSSFTSHWDYDMRPLRPNAHFVDLAGLDFRDYDLALLHFDELSLASDRANGKFPLDWGAPFQYLMGEFPGPKIAVCHGAPLVYGAYDRDVDLSQEVRVVEEERQRLVEFLKDTLVICVSHKVKEEWGFHKARTIWHGFEPGEFPPTLYEKPVITVVPGMLQRAQYSGYPLYRDVATRVHCQCDFLGDELPDQVEAEPLERSRYATPNEYAYAKFANYVALLRRYSIFFNPTLRSPMPRCRIEAMLCGLAIVTTHNYDEELVFQNGVNGFYSNEVQELGGFIDSLTRDPALARQIGQAGRRRAMEIFHIDRYHAEWVEVLRSLLGSHVRSAERS